MKKLFGRGINFRGSSWVEIVNLNSMRCYYLNHGENISFIIILK